MASLNPFLSTGEYKIFIPLKIMKASNAISAKVIVKARLVHTKQADKLVLGKGTRYMTIFLLNSLLLKIFSLSCRPSIHEATQIFLLLFILLFLFNEELSFL